MSDPENPFKSRDLKSRFDQEVDPKTGNSGAIEYTRVDRRYQNRRTKKDRRTDIRFEIDKEGRRKNQGRRVDDGVDVSL